MSAKTLSPDHAYCFSKAAANYLHYADVQGQAARYLQTFAPTALSDYQRAVDIGSGPIAHAFAAHDQQTLVHLDLSLSMLQQHNATAIQADMDHLPLQANSIDLVYSNMAMQWSQNIEQLIRAITNSLKPKGKVVFSVMLNDSWRALQQLFNECGKAHLINPLADADIYFEALSANGLSVLQKKVSTMHSEHDDMYALLHSIKGVGANYAMTAQQHSRLLRRDIAYLQDHYPLVNHQGQYLLDYRLLFVEAQK